jgi:6,7-dimethyl-8-ribityllumazine synthase
LDGSDIRIGIIRTRWNEEHVKNLVAGCRKALKECGVKDENIFETTVPGSYELPMAARFLALSGTVDAIVTAGVLIKGEVSVVMRSKYREGDFVSLCPYILN